MPSPLGHAVVAVAAGAIVARPPAERRAFWTQIGILAAVGIAPDLDLLVGLHSEQTHSVGAAVLVASLAAWRRWPVGANRWRIWLAVGLAWLSHPLVDALGADSSPPLGVMLLWPFSDAHVQSSLVIFAPISRRWWLPGFVAHNVLAVLREIVILGPLAAAVWVWRGPPLGGGNSHVQR